MGEPAIVRIVSAGFRGTGCTSSEIEVLNIFEGEIAHLPQLLSGFARRRITVEIRLL